MSEKQAPTSSEPPPPSYQQVVGYQGYGKSHGTPGYIAQGQQGFNTNYITDYGTGQQTAVLRQPGAFSGSLNPVPDHMGLAIFATVLCCWPIGIFAILKAQDARRALERGDVLSAMKMSAESKRYCLISVFCGGVLIIGVVTVVTIVVENANDEWGMP